MVEGYLAAYGEVLAERAGLLHDTASDYTASEYTVSEYRVAV